MLGSYYNQFELNEFRLSLGRLLVFLPFQKVFILLLLGFIGFDSSVNKCGDFLMELRTL